MQATKKVFLISTIFLHIHFPKNYFANYFFTGPLSYWNHFEIGELRATRTMENPVSSELKMKFSLILYESCIEETDSGRFHYHSTGWRKKINVYHWLEVSKKLLFGVYSYWIFSKVWQIIDAMILAQNWLKRKNASKLPVDRSLFIGRNLSAVHSLYFFFFDS